jgi:hypothetical protein
MARQELGLMMCRLPFLERFFYGGWRLTPREIENLKASPETKEIIWGVSKDGFVFRYVPERRKDYEKLAAQMWGVFEENGIIEEGGRFKEFYKENFSDFDFEIHRRVLCLLDFCREGLTDQAGENFVDALLSVAENRDYFDLGDRQRFIKDILFWDPFGPADERLHKWFENLGEEMPIKTTDK